MGVEHPCQPAGAPAHARRYWFDTGIPLVVELQD
jgi:hypothetical protein